MAWDHRQIQRSKGQRTLLIISLSFNLLSVLSKSILDRTLSFHPLVRRLPFADLRFLKNPRLDVDPAFSLEFRISRLLYQDQRLRTVGHSHFPISILMWEHL